MRGRHLGADDRVIALARLADVVIQQRQHQQLRRACTSRRIGANRGLLSRRSALRTVSSVCSSTVYL